MRGLVLASPIEARLCRDEEIVLVGGGNSAGQAAVFLRTFAAKIWLLVRGPSLAESMSQYLIDRIRAIDNIEVLTQTEIVALYGSREKQLERVRWRYNVTGEETEKLIRHVFLFIGAEPATAWLRDSGIALDTKNFILTGSDVPSEARRSNNGSGRPLSLETSVLGVFASGDVQSGSVKRVGAAIGEGAVVGAELHAALTNGAAVAPRAPRPSEAQRHQYARHDFVFDGRQGVDGLAWQSSKAARRPSRLGRCGLFDIDLLAERKLYPQPVRMQSGGGVEYLPVERRNQPQSSLSCSKQFRGSQART